MNSKIPTRDEVEEKNKWDNPNNRDIDDVKEYLNKRIEYLDNFMRENLEKN